MTQRGTVKLCGTDPEIQRINQLVTQAQQGDTEAMEALLVTFNDLILFISNKYFVNNKDLVTFDDVHSFVQSMFTQLTLVDYTIGGRAYYNVFVRRMLNMRTLDFIERLIRYKKRHRPIIEECIMDELNDPCAETQDDTINRLHAQDVCQVVSVFISQTYSERDVNMFYDFSLECMSYSELSVKYGLSVCRVSSIVGRIRSEVKAKFSTLMEIESLDD